MALYRGLQAICGESDPLMQKKIVVLNGPNLNLLGSREPDTYGTTTLDQIKALVTAQAQAHDLSIDFRQSNVEGDLVNWLQEADHAAHGVILNAAAYTHTSIALHDAIAAISIPVIEVHLSNIFAREQYRHHSYISDVAAGVICGFGATGYVLAVDALVSMLRDN
jgi:3-dehydroquinate dehydratase-2